MTGRTIPCTSTSVPSGCSISVRTHHVFPIPYSIYFKQRSPFLLLAYILNSGLIVTLYYKKIKRTADKLYRHIYSMSAVRFNEKLLR